MKILPASLFLVTFFCATASAEVVFENSGGTLSLPEAAVGDLSFGANETVAIQGGNYATNMEQGATNNKISCSSLKIAADSGARPSVLYVVRTDLEVAKDILVGGGNRGSLVTQGRGNLSWGGELVLKNPDKASVPNSFIYVGGVIRGGSMDLGSGLFCWRIYTPQSVESILKEGTPLVRLNGVLNISDKGKIKVTPIEQMTGQALLPGEYPLILCKSVKGELPEFSLEGGDPNQAQKISLKKTETGLFLVVKP